MKQFTSWNQNNFRVIGRKKLLRMFIVGTKNGNNPTTTIAATIHNTPPNLSGIDLKIA